MRQYTASKIQHHLEQNTWELAIKMMPELQKCKNLKFQLGLKLRKPEVFSKIEYENLAIRKFE